MDAIPVETHAAELAATVDDIERGLTQLPLSKAVNRIDDWRREILATERADLRALADDPEPRLTATDIDRYLTRIEEPRDHQ